MAVTAIKNNFYLIIPNFDTSVVSPRHKMWFVTSMKIINTVDSLKGDKRNHLNFMKHSDHNMVCVALRVFAALYDKQVMPVQEHHMGPERFITW